MNDDQPLNIQDRVNGDCMWTGYPRRVYSSVCRSLSALTREPCVGRFKIGITNNPCRRFAAYIDAYDEMILLYQSDSIQHVSEMEAKLIEHNRELARNRIGGGGGNIGRFGLYYVYVVLYLRRAEKSPIGWFFEPFFCSLFSMETPPADWSMEQQIGR